MSMESGAKINILESSSGNKVVKPDGHVAFGQMREDARAEVALLRKLRNDARVVAICSGGCTALSLLTIGESRINAVDLNGGQIYLTELKAKALTEVEFEKGRGYFWSDPTELLARIDPYLTEKGRSYWNHHKQTLKNGILNCGSVDAKVKGLRDAFFMTVHNANKTETMLTQTNIKAQQNLFSNEWDTFAWKMALKLAVSKPNLELGQGSLNMHAVPKDYEAQIQNKIARAFTNSLTNSNTYLWQTYLGRFPEKNEEALPPYMRKSNLSFLRYGLPRLTLINDDIISFLRDQGSESLDFFVLSNLLDFYKPDFAQQVSEEIARVGRSGGIVCVRSLVPRTDPLLADRNRRLIFDANISKEIENIDQGCYCNFIQVYGIR